jgi:16S rRNA (uracil1498-N3)-methyltransferase
MTRRRWIADETSGDRAALVGEQAVHLARVLRARIGQEFEIAAENRVRIGRVVAVTPERVEFDLGDDIPVTARPTVHLLLAVFKFDRMEWAVEKATELGVAAITPLLAQRSEKNLCAAAEKRVERWRRIAREAAQQSRRTSPPEIFPPVRLSEILEVNGDVRIVLDPQGAALLTSLGSAGRTTALAIGPEGGWSDAELKRFQDSGWLLASLGPTILRAETAAIAALAVVMQLLSS